MPEDKFKWLKTAFPVHGIGWQLVGPLIAVGVVAAAAAVWLLLRDSAEDFLTADVQVWHLLVTVGAGVVGILAFIIWWTSRQMSAPEVAAKVAHHPPEIDHFGVLWPATPILDTHNRVANFNVGKPMCRKCRSTLGWLKELAADDYIPETFDDRWEELVGENLRLTCFKDGSQYDLRQHGWEMGGLTKVVNEVAMGEYRTAQAEAREKRK